MGSEGLEDAPASISWRLSIPSAPSLPRKHREAGQESVEKNQATHRDFPGTRRKRREVTQQELKEGKVDEGVCWARVQA
jgi:hypothetical protein